MEIIDEGRCFVCGNENEHGLRLSFTSENGRTVSEFTLQKYFQGYKDIIHGGIISAILDEAMIHAAVSEKLSPVTAEITVRFKQPLSVGRPAMVIAELTNKGPRLIEARARLSDRTSGALIAEATGKLIPLKEYP
ncbi:MAG TPA: PaaI family thioesterase [Dissulfurispiraceae bacterium]|nr:PaaI family thioesterase [Dissulfurispiraceae bacterium]